MFPAASLRRSHQSFNQVHVDVWFGVWRRGGEPMYVGKMLSMKRMRLVCTMYLKYEPKLCDLITYKMD